MVKPTNVWKKVQEYPEEASKNFQGQWQSYVVQLVTTARARHWTTACLLKKTEALSKRTSQCFYYNGLMDHGQVSGRCSRTGIKTKGIKDEQDAGLRFPKGIKIAYSTRASFTPAVWSRGICTAYLWVKIPVLPFAWSWNRDRPRPPTLSS